MNNEYLIRIIIAINNCRFCFQYPLKHINFRFIFRFIFNDRRKQCANNGRYIDIFDVLWITFFRTLLDNFTEVRKIQFFNYDYASSIILQTLQAFGES